MQQQMRRMSGSSEVMTSEEINALYGLGNSQAPDRQNLAGLQRLHQLQQQQQYQQLLQQQQQQHPQSSQISHVQQQQQQQLQQQQHQIQQLQQQQQQHLRQQQQQQQIQQQQQQQQQQQLPPMQALLSQHNGERNLLINQQANNRNTLMKQQQLQLNAHPPLTPEKVLLLNQSAQRQLVDLELFNVRQISALDEKHQQQKNQVVQALKKSSLSMQQHLQQQRLLQAQAQSRIHAHHVALQTQSQKQRLPTSTSTSIDPAQSWKSKVTNEQRREVMKSIRSRGEVTVAQLQFLEHDYFTKCTSLTAYENKSLLFDYLSSRQAL